MERGIVLAEGTDRAGTGLGRLETDCDAAEAGAPDPAGTVFVVEPACSTVGTTEVPTAGAWSFAISTI